MKTYLVFEPAGAGRNAETADAVRFVPESFYWSALLFALPWLVWHRLWSALLGWSAAEAAIAGAAYALDFDPTATSIALLLPSLVVAFEGSELRRRWLLRAGYRDAGVAMGVDLEDAEQRFFAGWKSAPGAPVRPTPPARVAAPPAPPAAATKSVVGLFPQPRGGR